MDDHELPQEVRDKVAELRRQGGARAAFVERMLEKRAAADGAERARLDRLILDLGKVSGGAPLVAAVLVAAVALMMARWVTTWRYNEAVEAGLPTVARVLSVDKGECGFSPFGNNCLTLKLRLHPPGGDPYEASLTHDIDPRWMPRLKPGRWLTVAVDFSDPALVYFDKRTMSVPPPKPPAKAAPDSATTPTP